MPKLVLTENQILGMRKFEFSPLYLITKIMCQTKEGENLDINWGEKPESDWQKDYKRTKSYADQLLDEVDREFHSVWYVVYTDGTTDMFSAELTLELLCEYLDNKKEVRKIEKKEVRKFVISNNAVSG